MMLSNGLKDPFKYLSARYYHKGVNIMNSRTMWGTVAQSIREEDPFGEDPRIVLANYLDYLAMTQGYGQSPKDDFRKQMKNLVITDFEGTVDSYRATISCSLYPMSFEDCTYVLARQNHDNILNTDVYTPMSIDMDGNKDWNDSSLLFSSSPENTPSDFVGELPKDNPDASQFELIRRVITSSTKRASNRNLFGGKDIKTEKIIIVDFKVGKGQWHSTAVLDEELPNSVSFDASEWLDQIKPNLTRKYQEYILGDILVHYGQSVQHLDKDVRAIKEDSFYGPANDQVKYIGTDGRAFTDIDWSRTRVAWDVTHTDSNHLTGTTTYLLIPFYGLYDSSKGLS